MTPQQFYYLAPCAAGLFVPASFGFAPWVEQHGLNLPLFLRDLSANQVSAFFALDVTLSAVVVISFAYAERGQMNRRLWLPAAGVLLGGVSFGLQLLLPRGSASQEVAGGGTKRVRRLTVRR